MNLKIRTIHMYMFYYQSSMWSSYSYSDSCSRWPCSGLM